MIPNICHFVFGFKEQNEEFLFCYYLAVYSAFIVNKPEKINFFYHHEPHGPWWEKLKKIPCVSLIHIPIPTHIGKKIIKKTAHKADWVRMNVLYQYGGIYLDIDSICIKPWKDLLKEKVVLATQIPIPGICNAIMMTEPQSEFFKIWLDRYEKPFNPDGWEESSIFLPLEIMITNFDKVTMKNPDTFFIPHFKETEKIFELPQEIPKNLVSLHLWESYTMKYMKNINDWSWAYKNTHTMYGKMMLNLLDNYIMKNENYCNDFFVMTLWSPSIPYFMEIIDDIKEKFNVKILESKKKEINDNKLLDYILKIYEPDKRCVKSYLKEKVNFILSNSLFKNTQPIYHYKISFNNTSFNNQIICNECIELKEYIRMKIKNRLNNYLKDIIIHVTDNFEESKIVWDICNDSIFDKLSDNFKESKSLNSVAGNSIIKKLFNQINESKISYLVLKYEAKQFSDNYELGGDIDILTNHQEKIILLIEEFLKNNKINFKTNKACDFSYSKNDLGRTYLDIYFNNKEHFDLRLDIFSLSDWNFYGYKINEQFNHLWYLKNMMALRIINDEGIYVPSVHFECSFRVLELIKYPNKERHKIFLRQHSDIAPKNGTSYIEKFINKNDGISLNDLKISVYNKEKMELYLENKIQYNEIFDIVPLSESPHIKFLETKDKNVFINYHNIVNQDPQTSQCNKNYSIKRFMELSKNILESNNCNYNIKINNNLIVDGCHRASILYFYFGGDYMINNSVNKN